MEGLGGKEGAWGQNPFSPVHLPSFTSICIDYIRNSFLHMKLHVAKSTSETKTVMHNCIKLTFCTSTSVTNTR